MISDMVYYLDDSKLNQRNSIYTIKVLHALSKLNNFEIQKMKDLKISKLETQ